MIKTVNLTKRELVLTYFLEGRCGLRKEFEKLDESKKAILKKRVSDILKNIEDSGNKISEEVVCRIIKFEIFILKYYDIYKSLETYEELYRKELYRNNYKRIYERALETYNTLKDMGLHDDDIYRILKIFLPYIENPRNVYTKLPTRRPIILRDYYNGKKLSRKRKWFFKPEKEADDMVYKDWKKFVHTIYMDQTFLRILLNKQMVNEWNLPSLLKSYDKLKQSLIIFEDNGNNKKELIYVKNKIIDILIKAALINPEISTFDVFYGVSGNKYAIIRGFILEITDDYIAVSHTATTIKRNNLVIRLKINRNELDIKVEKGLEILALVERKDDTYYKPLIILTNNNSTDLSSRVYTYQYLLLISEAITRVTKKLLEKEVNEIVKAEGGNRDFYLEVLANKFIIIFFTKYKHVYKITPPVKAFLTTKTGEIGYPIALTHDFYSVVERTIRSSEPMNYCLKCRERDSCKLYKLVKSNADIDAYSFDLSSIKYTDLEVIYYCKKSIQDVYGEKIRIYSKIRRYSKILGKRDCNSQFFIDKLEFIERERTILPNLS